MTEIPAGFYDDGAGRQRWWDGTAWTEQFQEAPAANVSAVSAAVAKMVAVDDTVVPGQLWSAIGKPLTGIGAGKYRLTATLLYFEKGTLSLKAQQIPTHEIHDVDAAQTITQKARGVGTITLTVMRAHGREIVTIEDIPNFREGVTIINETAHTARDTVRVKQQTQHVNYAGGMPVQGMVQAAAPAAAAPVALDLNTELARLAQFRDDGILDAEEFTAAKRKLLGL